MDEFWFKVTFIYRNHDAGSVYLVGDFCGWKTDAHKMEWSSEGYQITLPLAEGFYHYKFYVDGNWVVDEHNPHRAGGYGNSIMFVHMDPGVYGIKPQHPPHRDYHRPLADGSQFQVLCPKIPSKIALYGILERLVFVYLPPSYHSDLNRHYPLSMQMTARTFSLLLSTWEHLQEEDGI